MTVFFRGIPQPFRVIIMDHFLTHVIHSHSGIPHHITCPVQKQPMVNATVVFHLHVLHHMLVNVITHKTWHVFCENIPTSE